MLMKHRHSYWLIALLVLVFFGQSLTVAAMPCQFMDVSPAGHKMNHSMDDMNHSMDDMNHSMAGMHHDMNQMDGDQNESGNMNSAHDCCKTLGHCSSSSCSAPAMSYHLELNLPANNILIAGQYHQHIPNSPISSLYRPPIFC